MVAQGCSTADSRHEILSLDGESMERADSKGTARSVSLS